MRRKKNGFGKRLRRLFTDEDRDAETAALVELCLREEDVVELRDVATTKGWHFWPAKVM